MATWRPDPTFYPSPRLATQAPPEKLAYVATLDPTEKVPTLWRWSTWIPSQPVMDGSLGRLI